MAARSVSLFKWVSHRTVQRLECAHSTLAGSPACVRSILAS